MADEVRVTVIGTGFDHRPGARCAATATAAQSATSRPRPAHRRSPALDARDLRRRHRRPAVPALSGAAGAARLGSLAVARRPRSPVAVSDPRRRACLAAPPCPTVTWPPGPSWWTSPAGRCRSSTTRRRAEHMAVRERCGVFDVSHMGEIETAGPQARWSCCSGCSPTTSSDDAGCRRGAVQRAVPRGRRRARRPVHLPAWTPSAT